jgi:hypothetical protein
MSIETSKNSSSVSAIAKISDVERMAAGRSGVPLNLSMFTTCRDVSIGHRPQGFPDAPQGDSFGDTSFLSGAFMRRSFAVAGLALMTVSTVLLAQGRQGGPMVAVDVALRSPPASNVRPWHDRRFVRAAAWRPKSSRCRVSWIIARGRRSLRRCTW